jgi:hypothetical protein
MRIWPHFARNKSKRCRRYAKALTFAGLATFESGLIIIALCPVGFAITASADPSPVAAACAQHFYGLTETPKPAGGRVALRLALLSPTRGRTCEGANRRLLRLLVGSFRARVMIAV